MTSQAKLHLPADRYFDPDPRQKEVALQLYKEVAAAPLVCPRTAMLTRASSPTRTIRSARRPNCS
jgi:hypothetical protein